MLLLMGESCEAKILHASIGIVLALNGHDPVTRSTHPLFVLSANHATPRSVESDRRRRRLNRLPSAQRNGALTSAVSTSLPPWITHPLGDCFRFPRRGGDENAAITAPHAVIT